MKKTSCGELRDRLTKRAEALHEPATERHVKSCAACRGYAERLSTARRLLRDHRVDVQPDAGFSERVLARIPSGPTEVLGWAAVRLLPAGIALALVLVWFAFQIEPTSSTTAEATAPTEDLLSWVIDPSGDGR